MPPHLEELCRVMTNLDHSYDQEKLRRLVQGNCFGTYPGWNFHGLVWWDDLFHCEVWVHREPQEVISAATPEELMRKVSEKYGSD